MRLSRTLAILSFAACASAAGSYNAFLGCVVNGSGMVPTNPTATGQTRASCQTTCKSATVGVPTTNALGQTVTVQVPADISFWSPQGNCYCGITMALAGAAASTTNTNTLYHQGDSYGNCLNGQDLTADYVLSNLRFEGCSSSQLPSPGYSGSVLSPEKCIDYCYNSASPTYNTATTIPSGTGYTCNCYTSLSTSLTQTPSQCGPAAYNVYSAAKPGASVAMRKRSERLLAEKKLRGNTPCPKPLDACVIEGTSDYECLDTTNELESCGGCLAGYFESNRSAGGVNCAAIPGVAKHGVMCAKNECVVSKCRYGWKLVDGRCEQLTTRHVAARK